MNRMQLSKYNVEAFNALPEPYRIEDCCNFFRSRGFLYAEPMGEQREILGYWISRYDTKLKEWILIQSE